MKLFGFIVHLSTSHLQLPKPTAILVPRKNLPSHSHVKKGKRKWRAGEFHERKEIGSEGKGKERKGEGKNKTQVLK